MIQIHKNIVFIGAPGCGKTTIGKLTAKKLLLPFCDVDEYIEEKEGKRIKDIFINGEAYFRKIETAAIKEVIKTYPKVISTGGGAVKIPENMKMLNNNSVIIFLNRPLDKIVGDINVSTRPLLAEDPFKVYELYKERYPLYKKYCHYEILNDKLPSEIADEIIKIFSCC